ncbi:MAG: SusC/RagA family TonB-linked outer membrane protein, partial [Candidatus Cryptobacteroides sp.]
VNAETGVVQPTKIPDFVNSVELAETYNSDYRINHGYDYYDAETIEMYRTGADPDLFPNVNWIDGLFKKVTTNQKANASISGGGDIVKYYVSGAYYHEGGMYKVDDMNRWDTNVDYTKFNFRSNVDVKVTPSTTLNVNLSTIYETKVTPNTDMDYIWKSAYIVSPNAVPMRYSDGSLAVCKGSSAGNNPYNLITQSGFREFYTTNAQSLIGITQDFSDIITKGLMFNAKVSYDAINTSRLNYGNEPEMFIATGRDDEGQLILERVRNGASQMNYSKSSTGNKIFYFETSLAYNRDFNKHSVGGLLMFNLKSRKDVQAADINKSIPYRNQGIAGRVTYGYDNRYYLEANFGYNGSENFSPGKRFGFFPSIAAGWRISEEKFFAPAKRVINKLKLRASYGTVGNDNIGGNRRFIYNGTFVDSGSYMFGNGTYNNYAGIRVGDYANPDVGWETSTKLDAGVEFSLFNFIDVQASYFQDHRTGIFLEYKQMSDVWGINSAPWLNFGETKNRGIDVDVNGTRRFGEVTVSLRGNFTFNRSEVIENAEAPAIYPYRDMRGKPIGQQTGLVALGLFQSQEEIDNSPVPSGLVRVGDIKYMDVNGDGKIDENDYVPIGRTGLPEITYGFGASLQWKGFDFSAFFQGTGNVTMFLDGPAVKPFSSGDPYMSGFYKEVYNNMWTLDNPNPNATYPRVSELNSVNNNQYRSTFWQRDVSYLRLKNATIGYTLPSKLTKKARISAVRFYITGYNLLTFSKFKLFDPEIGAGKLTSDGRFEGNAYPPSRTVTFGFNISFE